MRRSFGLWQQRSHDETHQGRRQVGGRVRLLRGRARRGVSMNPGAPGTVEQLDDYYGMNAQGRGGRVECCLQGEVWAAAACCAGAGWLAGPSS